MHPFARVIAGWYKKGGAAHRCKSDMYVCDLCNWSFSTQRSLKRHRESVHRQSAGFSCQVCGQRFYRKDVLQTHQTAELPAHLAACPTDATVDSPPPPPPFPAPGSHGERPVCDLCAETFTSQKTLAERAFIVNRTVFAVKYAANAFSGKTKNQKKRTFYEHCQSFYY